MANKSLLVVLTLATLAVIASATHLHKPFTVHGKVYCDTCRCGFETNVTTYIPDAKVQLQCKGRDDLTVVYTQDGVTDKTGSYVIKVEEDHGDQICDVVLVSSPWSHCSKPDSGRSKTRVAVTNNNGIISPKRYANNVGFLMDHSLPVCSNLVHYYLHAYE